MAGRVLVFLGTKKGAFILEGDGDRASWQLRGPYCETWPLNHVKADPKTGHIYAAGGSEWFGPAIWKSTDLGDTWTHSSNGLAYGEGEEPIKAGWSLAFTQDGLLYAGVQPAGLFVSRDGGERFEEVRGLRDHPTRPQWQPGGAGLILHSLLVDPDDTDRIWVGISSAGVFYSGDGGRNWEPRNRGTRADFMPEGQNYPEFGQCVHCLVMAAGGGDRLYQQNHCGMYISEDGARTWHSIEAGLPSTFGFPAVAHPRERDTLYLLPLNGDVLGRYMPDAKTAVWRTRNAGREWEALRDGLPQHGAYFNVLRQAMAADDCARTGIYFGTSSGTVFASRDEGESWSAIAEHLPTILSVETLTLDD